MFLVGLHHRDVEHLSDPKEIYCGFRVEDFHSLYHRYHGSCWAWVIHCSSLASPLSIFPHKAAGSLIKLKDGTVVGSELIAQLHLRQVLPSPALGGGQRL